MPNRTPNSFRTNPLNITYRLTESGKREMREACVQFVSSEPLSPLMRDARRLLQRAGMAEQLIRVQSEQYVLSCLKKPDVREQVFGIFVLEQFSGSIYEELRKRSKENDKCRIIRPLTIIQSAGRDSEVRIPFKPHPLLSLAMAGMAGIALSGDFAPDERNQLSRQILLMGGTAQTSVNQRKTSVVVGRTMSDSRCVFARHMVPALPVVTAEWVRHCFEESDRNNLISGKAVYQKFLLPVFAGLTLSPAQIGSEERGQLMRAAVNGGYTYLPDLDKDRTTHLICVTAEGKKWEAARLWGMHTVSYEWVIGSFAKGFALPEKDYLIGPADCRSEAECSVLQDLFQESRLERKRCGKERRVEHDSHLNRDVRRVRRSHSPASGQSGGTQGLSALTQTLHVSRLTPSHSAAEKQVSFTEENAHLLDEDNRNDVFSGLEFALVSCDAEKTNFFKKLILSRSGYLKNCVTDDVNYVLVGKDELDDEAKDLMEQVRESGYPATFVSYKWLTASAEKGVPEDDDAFRFDDKYDEATQSVPAAEPPKLGFKVTKKDYSQRNIYKSLTSICYASGTMESIGDDALINEYSRRSDSTQSVPQVSSQEDDITDWESEASHSQWIHVGEVEIEERHVRAGSVAQNDWNDACSVVSHTRSVSAASNPPNSGPIAVGSQWCPGAVESDAQTARAQRAQAILNVNNETALSEIRQMPITQSSVRSGNRPQTVVRTVVRPKRT